LFRVIQACTCDDIEVLTDIEVSAYCYFRGAAFASAQFYDIHTLASPA
jgi:hypothetical protein